MVSRRLYVIAKDDIKSVFYAADAAIRIAAYRVARTAQSKRSYLYALIKRLAAFVHAVYKRAVAAFYAIVSHSRRTLRRRSVFDDKTSAKRRSFGYGRRGGCNRVDYYVTAVFTASSGRTDYGNFLERGNANRIHAGIGRNARYPSVITLIFQNFCRSFDIFGRNFCACAKAGEQNVFVSEIVKIRLSQIAAIIEIGKLERKQSFVISVEFFDRSFAYDREVKFAVVRCACRT